MIFPRRRLLVTTAALGANGGRSEALKATKAKMKGYEPDINVRLDTWNLAYWHWV